MARPILLLGLALCALLSLSRSASPYSPVPPSLTRTLSSRLLSALSLTPSAKRRIKNHPYFAAVCIALSGNCNGFYERYSGRRCSRRTVFNAHKRNCYNYACNWCDQHNHRFNRYPCGHWRVRRMCYFRRKRQGPFSPNQPSRPRPRPTATTAPAPPSKPSPVPKPAPTKKPTPPGTGTCTWVGSNNRVVIGLGSVPLKRGWDRITRGKFRGIVFRRSPHRGITPPGKVGAMCFNVRAPASGNYYLTSISYAPHHTEHNDAWVQTSLGFQLWQHGSYRTYVGPGKWTKAYQNNGKKGISEMWKTIDFNGHRFIVPNVKKNVPFKVCIAGRSKKYEVYQILLIKCTGNKYCKGGIMKDLFHFKPSRCVW